MPQLCIWSWQGRVLRVWQVGTKQHVWRAPVHHHRVASVVARTSVSSQWVGAGRSVQRLLVRFGQRHMRQLP